MQLTSFIVFPSIRYAQFYGHCVVIILILIISSTPSIPSYASICSFSFSSCPSSFLRCCDECGSASHGESIQRIAVQAQQLHMEERERTRVRERDRPERDGGVEVGMKGADMGGQTRCKRQERTIIIINSTKNKERQRKNKPGHQGRVSMHVCPARCTAESNQCSESQTRGAPSI